MCPGEAVLLDALERIGDEAFGDCPEIKMIWVENSSVADSLKRECNSVIPLAKSTMIGDRLLWDLRKQREVVIPEGTECIGRGWFMNSSIESVEISASVLEI